MWNGSRPGPRGGMPFRGEPCGGMFEGRDGPRADFRGRDGMNMDRPSMDMRRFDSPPDMRGRDIGLLDRGREPSRDFFRPGDDMDINFRRRFEMDQRNNLQSSPGFMGQSRPPIDIMRGPDDGYMNMRERDRFEMDMPGHPPMDIRRRLKVVAMVGNGDLGDIRERDRPRMGGIDGFSMDMPPRDRPVMDFERRGAAPPLNPRGRFDSDMDLRNRMGSSGDFRDQPPQMFRDDDGIPMGARGRPDMPLGRGGPESMIRAEELTLRDREFPEAMDSPMGFRGREIDSHSDEWRSHGMRDRDTLPPVTSRTPPLFPREMKERFFPNRGKDGDLSERSPFKDRDRQSGGLIGKDSAGLPRSERGSMSQNWDKNGRDLAHGNQKPPVLPLEPPLNAQSREGEKLWPSDRDEKPDRIVPTAGRPPLFQDKIPPNQEHRLASDRVSFKGSSDMNLDQRPQRESLMSGPKEPQSKRGERLDQDFMDIDYRTSSGQKYDYNLADLQGPEKDVNESKLGPPQRSDDSGSQDQDYRSAGVQDKVSKTISISGIPKTATMKQILNAFAVRDGVPMQGMKIKDVVPGYSFDMAYVEFLNLEDAVHFMESNQGSVKVGDKTALLKYIQPDKNLKEQHHEPPVNAAPASEDSLLPNPVPQPPLGVKEEPFAKPVQDPVSQGVWQRSSNLTPEAWQQQVDQQLRQQEAEQKTEEWGSRRTSRQNLQHSDPVFKESKTMIIKNILPTTTMETILQALDPFAYLDERNVRLVKGKSPGSKCFCFVDMDSHEHVTRLVDLLTKPRPIMIDGVRVYAEVAKPLKNQNYRRDNEKSNTSLLGFPPDIMMQKQQQNQYPQQQYYPQPHTAMGIAPAIQGDTTRVDTNLSSAAILSSSLAQDIMYSETTAMAQPVQTAEHQTAALPEPALPGPLPADTHDAYIYESDAPDLSAFLYDATSGFYYDPQTTLYYDPNSRYFYEAQNQQYLYWDSTSKTYIPVQSSSIDVQEPAPEVSVPVAAVGKVIATPITEEEVKQAVETMPDMRVEEEPAPRAEKKEKEKEEKPKSLAAFKIMKDMERWAKIQNRQKEIVRAPSPVLKSGGDDQKPSKAADAAYAIFERKVGGDDLFKKPLASAKKEEKLSKRPMGSLGMLAADYGAGSDEEEEEKHEKQEALRPVNNQSQVEKEERLTDWKKMACLLCRRQFPNKDALIRHQQLSDLHKQNMEIHTKIKRSKRELEALEYQEKELTIRESNGSPETKRRKQQNTWAGSSRGSHKGSERPGLGLETTERKKKESVVWDHATYKQAVRKAMFARFNELD
ncbi:RNA-binding protein 6-like [Myxocyprinus asiaticus]|uniref:RNA-binding protein 6-like n=1 Tax=Myxocyprinus asiaticus TaxID=70543 RepID=UPI0022234B78|nr:RNA-binding protein 6-like [Myxocyprinus asiaticus]